MGGFARGLALPLRSIGVGCAAAGVALALARVLAPVVRLLFDHVTTLRVLAVAGLFGICTLVVRVLSGRAAAPWHDRASTGASRRVFGELLRRLPTDIGLGVIVGCSIGAWFAVARATHIPSVFGDELIYSGLGKGVARGEGLSLLGTPEHGYGVIYPLVISPFYRLATDGAAAYSLIKAVNAIAMSAAAVAAYFVARRVVARNWALVVAGLTVVVPAMTYARLVMTEPLAYSTFLVFALALVRALEVPTIARQVVCLATLALAVGVRVQAVALVPALAASVVVFGVSAGQVRTVLRRFGTTWVLLVVGAAVALALAKGHPQALLGSYSVLARSYSAAGLLKWLVWTTATLEFAAAIVPVFALCIVVPRLLRRSAGTGERALGAVAVSWTIWIVASTTVISASPYGLDRLHERNLFYVLPLLFACLAHWIEQGRGVPRRRAVPILVALTALPLTLPERLVHTDSGFDAPSMFPWANIDAHLGPVPVGVAMGLATVLAIAWASLSRLTIVPVLVVITIFYTVIAEAAYHEPATTAADRSAWVDDALSPSAHVLLLHVHASTGCPQAPEASGGSMRLTEFFNVSIDRVAHLFSDIGDRGLGSPAAHVSRGGLLVSAGHPLRARYVVTEAGVQLVGRPLAQAGASQDSLVLWRTGEPLRLATPWLVVPRANGAGGTIACSLEDLLARTLKD